MIQEYKNILLRDLCARMPYEVKCKYYNVYENCYEEGTVLGFERKEYIVIDGRCVIAEEVRPYLFPLLIMTEEQRQELESLMEVTTVPVWGEILSPTPEYYDWLNVHHFDYRGLIEKSLALDATGLNIY